MQTRVIVNGAHGKMGSLAAETIAEHSEFELVAELSHHDDLKKAIMNKNAQIVIDLTRADSVYNNTLSIMECGAHPVIGTTGLVSEQILLLQQISKEKQLGGIIVPNFSISAILMMRFAALAARYLPEVEIIEAHHQQKLDAPSGTALKTAEMIGLARQGKKNQLALKELTPGARGGTHHDVNIHSIRLPGILARQQVIFGNTGETLSLIHDSIDRRCFMPGLVLACQKVKQLDSLFYGLEFLLDE